MGSLSCCNCFSKQGSLSGGGVVVSNVYPPHLAQFLRDERTFVMNLYISIRHHMISTTLVSFAGQGLTLIY